MLDQEVLRGFWIKCPELNEKKIIKNEKKNGAGTEMGYCPNFIVTKGLGSWARRRGMQEGRAGGALGAWALGERGAGARKRGSRRRAARGARRPGRAGRGAQGCWALGAGVLGTRALGVRARGARALGKLACRHAA